MRTFTESVEGEFRRYRALAEGAMEQLSDDEMTRPAGGSTNSVATLARHLGGNLRSRFTDFLTTDGEKPWRDREGEFSGGTPSRTETMAAWNAGWQTLESALAALTDAHLADTVTIRGEPLSVVQALHRSLSHTAYHVGQIVHVARAIRGDDWTFLSIPPGGDADTGRNPA
jgi:hypothetical protein